MPRGLASGQEFPREGNECVGFREVRCQAEGDSYRSAALRIDTAHEVLAIHSAVWITDADLAHEEMEADIENPRLSAQSAVAFALVFVDRAGIDVTSRRVWSDSERVFQAVRDQGLGLWYRLKSAALRVCTFLRSGSDSDILC